MRLSCTDAFFDQASTKECVYFFFTVDSKRGHHAEEEGRQARENQSCQNQDEKRRKTQAGQVSEAGEKENRQGHESA